ncbi:MAG: hypothetical protein RBS39_08115 [Phycisphaerales bacterium]|jgi:hypothetical protein|nr:hypothetical protein [Phycisphaerales bacterium]
MKTAFAPIRLLAIFGAMIVALMTTRATRAQDMVVAPSDVETGVRVDASMFAGDLMIEDRTTGTPLVMRQLDPLYDHFPGAEALTARISMRPAPDGADVTLTLTNTASEPLRAGRVRIGLLNLGQSVLGPDPAHPERVIRGEREKMDPIVRTYPIDAYMPALVLRGERYAAGVSIAYPVLEYEHDVSMEASSPNVGPKGGGPRGYEIVLALSNMPDREPTLANECIVPPGEKRSYTISIRFTDQPDDWMRTLLPYRTYFRSRYGGVAYQRDPRAVTIERLARSAAISSDNPRGWVLHPLLRPDRNGWSPLASELEKRRNWDRVVLEGVAGAPPAEQYTPFHFVTALESDPRLNMMLSPDSPMRRVPELGFVWLRSGSIFGRQGQCLSIDPDVAGQQKHLGDEIGALQRAGASTIVLDEFDHRSSPLWKRIGWMQLISEQAPGVHMVVRGGCDLTHVLGAIAYDGLDRQASSADGLLPASTPFELADFLLPGHETWLEVDYDVHREKFNAVVSQSQVEADVARVASLGFVPAMYTSRPLRRAYAAHESWTSSVPASLLAPVFQEPEARHAIAQDEPAPTASPSPRTNETQRVHTPSRDLARTPGRGGVRISRPQGSAPPQTKIRVLDAGPTALSSEDRPARILRRKRVASLVVFDASDARDAISRTKLLEDASGEHVRENPGNAQAD